MKYQIRWEEWVYDAFDDIERINPQPEFTINACSIENAIKLAEKEASKRLYQERKAGRYLSHGEFIANVLGLTDERGFYHKLRNASHVDGFGQIKEIKGD